MRNFLPEPSDRSTLALIAGEATNVVQWKKISIMIFHFRSVSLGLFTEQTL